MECPFEKKVLSNQELFLSKINVKKWFFKTEKCLDKIFYKF